MRRIATYITVLVTTALACGCVKTYEPDQFFLEENNVVLKIDGKSKLKYDPEKSQLGFSPDRKQFRLHNDTMSEFFILTCSELPTKQGQNIKCSLKYCTPNEIDYKTGLEFNVRKFSDDTIWLWCKKKNIGLTVKTLN